MSKGNLTQNGVHLREHEYKTVKLLLEKGYDVELIPPSQIKGLTMPDIMLKGLPWEIKSPNGKSKNNIKHIIQKAKHQSSNIIIDLHRTLLEENYVIEEIKKHFTLSKRLQRLIIIKKNDEIIDITKK